ncbi:hypothetical protein MSG28_009055 [Choristoneura fumiferana]|uniref:Uncharacterized protein n=2 Tax=Choristoneura fumiferana TaxID=7141 RepID=A0ACC0KWL8_CHOFU|nr:hypothetical protein MSG28_009055 [Choristoneura fumiferana]
MKIQNLEAELVDWFRNLVIFKIMKPIKFLMFALLESKGILRARPHYKEMNLVAELLGFPETQCVYLTAEEHIEGMPCIKKRKYE